jgi:hypothetical protein
VVTSLTLTKQRPVGMQKSVTLTTWPAWLFSLVLSQNSKMHSNEWRYWTVPKHFQGFWERSGFVCSIVQFWFAPWSIILSILWEQNWIWHLEIYKLWWSLKIRRGTFDRIRAGSMRQINSHFRRQQAFLIRANVLFSVRYELFILKIPSSLNSIIFHFYVLDHYNCLIS